METNIRPIVSIGTLADRPVAGTTGLPLGYRYTTTDEPGGYVTYVYDPPTGWHREVPAPAPSTVLFLLAGSLQTDAGNTTRYWANEGGVTDSSPDPLLYDLPLDITFTTLRLQIRSNNLATKATFTLMKNGTPTTFIIEINAGYTGIATIDGAVAYAQDDTFDLRLENSGGGDGNILLGSAVLGRV